MDDIQKMLRAIINGQSASRQEIVSMINNLDVKLTKKIDDVAKDLRNLTKRVDKLGMNQAYLEDDTPTREDFDKLEKRVDKLEQKRHSGLSAN